MRIDSISIEGFRGFNQICRIEFDESLTIIYGPNSYGKTSITEALEWLLYGITSRVAEASSNNNKDEFRDSYRNRHFPSDRVPTVEAVLTGGDDRELTIRAELGPGDATKRWANGREAPVWPFLVGQPNAGSPFILQHALKGVLLAGPGDRFERLADLLVWRQLSLPGDDNYSSRFVWWG
jgi:hypothetical protein